MASNSARGSRLPATSVVLILATAVILAGCFGVQDPGSDPHAEDPAEDNRTPDGEPSPDDDPGGPQHPDGRTGSPDPANGTHVPPVPLLDASVLEGQAPLEVNFTLDVEGTHENATFTWVLQARFEGEATPANETGNGNATAGGNTTAAGNTTLAQGGPEGLPAEVNHTFEEPGTYNVTFTVDDGFAEGSRHLTINVTAAAYDGPDPHIITGTAAAGSVQGGPCVYSGVNGNLHDLSPAEGGWMYVIDVEPVTLFWRQGTTTLGSSDDPEGEVPEDADTVGVCPRGAGAGIQYTLTLTHPDDPR